MQWYTSQSTNSISDITFLFFFQQSHFYLLRVWPSKDFPGGPVGLNEGGLGLIPIHGTRSYMPQLKVLHAAVKMKDPHMSQLRPSGAKYIK